MLLLAKANLKSSSSGKTVIFYKVCPNQQSLIKAKAQFAQFDLSPFQICSNYMDSAKEDFFSLVKQEAEKIYQCTDFELSVFPIL